MTRLTSLWRRRAAGLSFVLTLLFVLVATATVGACPTAAGPSAARSALAETPPPGPLLGTGDHTDPQAGLLRGIWEAFPAENVLGHVLYIWDEAVWVSRAYPCPSATVTAPCYSWIQYLYTSDDFYNTDDWIPFQRGCTVLGANPLVASTAQGFSTITDLWLGDYASGMWQPVVQEAFSDAYLNPLGTGTGSVADRNEVFRACAGGPSGPPTGGGACAQYTLSGVWRTTQGNGYNPAFTFTQSGTALSGTVSLSGSEQARAGFRSPTGQVAGTLVGAAVSVTVTWQGASGPVVGRYTGTVTAGSAPDTGSLVGDAGGVSWSGTGPLTCAAGSSPSGGMTGGGTTICSWTGTWRSASNPDLVLTQSGAQVTGTFGTQRRVQGTVSGDTLTGTVTDAQGGVTQLRFRMNTKIDFSTGQQQPSTSTGCVAMSGFVGDLPSDFTK